jgi:sugar phosphate isomerase/epimerase
VKAIEWAIEHQFNAIEISGGVHSLLDLSRRDRQYIIDTKQRYDLRLSYHFPSETAPCSHDAERRQRDLLELTKTIKVGSELGFEVIVVHPGMVDVAGVKPEEVPNTKRLEAFAHISNFMQTVAPVAEEKGILLCLENLHYIPGYLIQQHSDLVEIVDAVDSKAVCITLDVGHAWGSGGIHEALVSFGRRIRHVHLHDCSGPQNGGNRGQHQEIGFGLIDYGQLTELVSDNDRIAVLEVFARENNESAILRSREAMQTIWGDAVA